MPTVQTFLHSFITSPALTGLTWFPWVPWSQRGERSQGMRHTHARSHAHTNTASICACKSAHHTQTQKKSIHIKRLNYKYTGGHKINIREVNKRLGNNSCFSQRLCPGKSVS